MRSDGSEVSGAKSLLKSKALYSFAILAILLPFILQLSNPLNLTSSNPVNTTTVATTVPTTTVNVTTTANPATTAVNTTTVSTTVNTTTVPTTTVNVTTTIPTTTTVNTTTVPTTTIPPTTTVNVTTTVPVAPLTASFGKLPKRMPEDRVSSLTVTASGGVPPYSYKWYETTPKGIESSPAANCINGTATQATCLFKPTEHGAYYVGVNVIDSSGSVFTLDPTILVGVYANTTVIFGAGGAEFIGNATGAIDNTYNLMWSVNGTYTNGTRSCTYRSFDNGNTTGQSVLLLTYGASYPCWPTGTGTLALNDGAFNVTFTAADAQNLSDTNSSTTPLIVDWPSGIFTNNVISIGQNVLLTVAWRDIGYCGSSTGSPVDTNSCTPSNTFHPYNYSVLLYKEPPSSCIGNPYSGNSIATNSVSVPSSLSSGGNDYHWQSTFSLAPTSNAIYCANVKYYTGGYGTLVQTEGTSSPANAVIGVTPALTTTLYSNQSTVNPGGKVKLWNVTTGGTGNDVYSYSLSNSVGVSEGSGATANVFTFNDPGKYTITLNVVDRSGETAASNVTITVRSNIVTLLTPALTYISADQGTRLSNTTSGGVPPYTFSYSVNAPLGSYSIANNIFTANAGTYAITLNVVDSDGFTASSTNVIVVTPPLVTLLSANRTNVVDNSRVKFTNTTTGGTGDDSFWYTLNNSAGVTQGANNIFTFAIAGKYNVTLNANDLTGEMNRSSIIITVNESLQLNQTAVLYPGTESTGIPVFSRGQVVTDTDSGASGGVPPYTYEWYVALPGSTTFNPASCGSGATGPMVGHVNPCKFTTTASSKLGQYHFQLQVTDNEIPPGSVTSSTEPFNLNASLKITSLTANRSFISADQQIKITNTTVNGTGGRIYNYTVISGPSNGLVGLGHNKFNFTKAGNYIIGLRVVDQSGENATANVPITVTPPLAINLTANWTYISAGQSVLFTNKTTGGTGNNLYTYSLSCSNGKSPYTLSGNKAEFTANTVCDVTLKVTDLTGEKNQSSVNITVTPPLNLTLKNTSRLYISAGQNVTFINTTSGGTGNDLFSYQVTVNPPDAKYAIGSGRITFNTAGNYLVSLGVTDKTGEVANSIGINVRVTPPLETTLKANWTYISAGQSALFSNTTTGGTGSNKYSYLLYPEECAQQSESNGMIFNFPQAGECTITLHVSDASGEFNQSNVTVNVTPRLNLTLKNTSRLYISTGQNVTFINTTSGGTGNDLFSYQVTVNPPDAKYTIGSGRITFNTAGNYLVSLGVTDKTGEVANSIGINVMVTPPLETTLKANWTYISAGQSALFSNTTTGGTGSNQYWYTSTDECASESEAHGNIFTFPSAGNCIVTLHVSDASGEYNESNVTVDITPPLKTNLTANWTYISAGQSVLFSNTTTGGTGNDLWTYSLSCDSDSESPYIINGNKIEFTHESSCYVTLKVTDLTGEKNQSSVEITVTPPLNITLRNTSRLYISAGQNVTFTNVTSGGTGNDLFSYQVTVNPPDAKYAIGSGRITFNTAGNYLVSLGVTDKTGEVANSIGINVRVTPPLETTLKANWTYISAGQSVLFSNVTNGGTGSDEYWYSTSPEECAYSSEGQANVFIFNEPGNCTVFLHVSDASGEYNESNVTVDVTPPLNLTLRNTSRLYISTGQSVSFSNTTTGGTGSNSWTYLIQKVRETPNENGSITFNTAGKYNVSLGVTDKTGEVANSLNITVTVAPPLVTTLKANWTYISAGQYVSFTNTTSGGTGDDQYSYTTSPESCAEQSEELGNSFLFPSAGNCIVTLHVSDASGEFNQSNVTVQVTPPLVTTLTANRTYISTGQNVTFTNVTSGGTGNVLYWYSTSPEECAYQGEAHGNNFTFPEAGNCTITLHVKDKTGEYNESSVKVEITPPLSISLTANRTFISEEQSVTFSNTTSYGTGDNQYYYTTSPEECALENESRGNSFTFTSTGHCNVILHVTDLTGEVNESNVTVNVTPQLKTTLIPNRTLISAGQSINLANLTTGGTGSNEYTLTVNDLSGVIYSGNVFTFNDQGNYLITLHVTDLSGEVSSSNVTVVVTPPLEVVLTSNKHKIVQGTTVTLTNVTTGGTGDNAYFYTVSNTDGVNFNGNKVSFADVGLFNITLHVSDLSGEKNQSTVPIVVDEPLVINESTTSTPLISRDQWVNISSEGPWNDSGVPPYTYQWLVKKPSKSTYVDANMCLKPTSLNCTFLTNSSTALGQYSFVLQVTDSESPKITIDAAPILITIDPALTINSFSATPNVVEAGAQVKFKNVTSGGTGSNVYNYTLLSGPYNGMAYNGNNKFTFTKVGNYLIRLYVTDLSGENASANTLVIVAPKLTVNLTANRTLISAGQEVRFTNRTNGSVGGNVYTYTLNNSAGVNESGNSFTFNDPGKYKVTLHVTDSANSVNQSSVTVVVTPALTTELSANLTSVSAGQSVKLTNVTSGGTGSNLFSYKVTVNPPDALYTSNGKNVYTFESPGSYDITLTVTDLSGEIATSNVTVTVTNTLTTTLTANRTTISAGQNVTFTNVTSGGTGSNEYYYSTSPEECAYEGEVHGNNFTFPSSGECKVTLHVSDASGEYNSSNVTIDVTRPLVITSFSANQSSVSAGQTVLLTNTTSGGTGSNQYSYQVSCDSESEVPYTINGNKVMFNAQGTCTVTLNVSDLTGETNQSSFEVDVTQPLTINLVANRTLISTGQNVTFTNTTYGGTGDNQYFYSTSPEECAYEGEVHGNNFTFPSSGECKVTLNVTDASGEVNSSNVTIDVVTGPAIELTANRTLISAGQNVTFTNVTTGGTGSNTYSYRVSCDSESDVPYTINGNRITFTAPGECTVRLNVTDLTGEVNSSSVKIDVTPALTTQIEENATDISAGQSVGFSNHSTGGTGNDINTYTINSTVTSGGSGQAVYHFALNGSGYMSIAAYVFNSLPGSGYTYNAGIPKSYNTTYNGEHMVLPVSSGESLYICAGGATTYFNGATWPSTTEVNDGNATQFSWSKDAESFASVDGFSGNASAVGRQTSHVCSDNTGAPADSAGPYAEWEGSSIVGVGLDNTNFTTVNDIKWGTPSLNYTVPNNHSFVVLIGATGGGGSYAGIYKHNTLPAGCNVLLNKTGISYYGYGTSGVFLAVCQNQPDITVSLSSNTTGVVQSSSNVFQFNAPGNYLVTLTTNDLSGEAATSNTVITVTSLLTTQLLPSTDTIDKGQHVAFTNDTVGGTGSNVYSYTLNNTEGVSESGNTFTFNDIGRYKVTLHVSDLSGEKANSSSIITVSTPPEIVLTPSTTTVDVGQGVNFTNVTSGGVPPYVAYAYTVNDLSGVSINGNSMSFDTQGNYLVTENVIDSIGGIGTSNPVVIHVNPQLVAITPSVSNSLVDQGQYETIGSQASGGTPPYNFNFTITNTLNGNVIYNFTLAGVTPSNTVSFTYNTYNVPILNDELGKLQVTLTVIDGVDNHVGTFAFFHASQALNSNVTASNSTPDVGQPINLTAEIAGGTTPFSYTLTVTNSSGDVISTGVIHTPSMSAVFAYTPGTDAIGTDNVSVFVVDSASRPGNETLRTTITVSNATFSPVVTAGSGSGSSGSSGGGGGSSGGGSSGGGGSNFVPTVVATNSSCVEILNFSEDNQESFSIGNNTFNVVENFINPNGAGVSINGASYALGPDEPANISSGYYVTLENVSYLPIQHTITVVLCGGSSLNTNAPSSNQTAITEPTTAPTTTMVTTIPTTTVTASADSSSGSGGQLSGSGNAMLQKLISSFPEAVAAIVIIAILALLAYLKGRR